MVYILATITIILVVQLVFVIWNLSYIKSVAAFKTEGSRPYERSGPLISILIPARNEEENIDQCLESVLRAVERLELNSNSEFQQMVEVLVLDDRSKDATFELVARRAAAAPRLQLLAGDDLPAGWLGKSWACHQLVQHARGRALLFLDADARLEADALVRICETGAPFERGMVTGFPRQVVRGAFEKLVVPLMSFTIACHLPVAFVRRSQDPKFAAAHGAFIFIARETYNACGGHEQFREHLVDDVMLARAVKKIGHPLHLLDVTDVVHMRMYRSAIEVWRGFKKNMFPGIGRNHFLFLLIVCLYSSLYLLPFATMAYYQTTFFFAPEIARTIPIEIPVLAVISYLLAVLIKLLIDAKHQVSLMLCWVLPISILFMILIMADSWRTSLFGGSYEWKGRRYS